MATATTTQENKAYTPSEDPAFHSQAVDIAMSLGLTEDEAYDEVDDFLGGDMDLNSLIFG